MSRLSSASMQVHPGRKRKPLIPRHLRGARARSNAPSPPPAAHEVDYVDRNIPTSNQDHTPTPDNDFEAGERIVSAAPVIIDGLIFTEFEPLLKIHGGEIGLSRPDEQRMIPRRARHVHEPGNGPVPDLRFTKHDTRPMWKKIPSARQLDYNRIGNLVYGGSQFKMKGGSEEGFATYKRNLRHPLEDHYNRLMAHLERGEEAAHSTAKMGTMRVEGTDVDSDDSDQVEENGPWLGDQLLQLLERK